METTIIHAISKSEIDYGILSMRHGDGTYTFFQTLPERFTISIRTPKYDKCANCTWYEQ